MMVTYDMNSLIVFIYTLHYIMTDNLLLRDGFKKTVYVYFNFPFSKSFETQRLSNKRCLNRRRFICLLKEETIHYEIYISFVLCNIQH